MQSPNENYNGHHQVDLTTDRTSNTLSIPPKVDGFGSSASGGELVLLALATCYSNDVYREANKKGIRIDKVEVEVAAEFASEGEQARNVT